MSKTTKLLGTIAIAGLIAAGGGALTAANQGVDDAYVGYDTATITGVNVTNVAYNVDPSDASKLSSIVFTETEDVSAGHDAILTINGPTGTQIACTPTFDTVGTITCLTPGQDITAISSISLTVSAN